MTGYGVSKIESENLVLVAEIKTLNSRYLDINVRSPKAYSAKEIDLRNTISETLTRGKVSLDIDLQAKGSPISKLRFNHDLFNTYYGELKKMADGVVANYDELFKLAIQSPDVMINETSEETFEEGWKLIQQGVSEACTNCQQFRIKEGEVLRGKMEEYIASITSNLAEVEKQDEKRLKTIGERIRTNVQDVISEEQFDENRFEQELIYYIEKLDISEEKVRLQSHLDHFGEVLGSSDSNGKKLGFISQEIGREINTIGAKANDAHMQKLVVEMKDELEKIKEQLANIL